MDDQVENISPSSPEPFTFEQDICKGEHTPITVSPYHENFHTLVPSVIRQFLQSASENDNLIGIAPMYQKWGILRSLTFSTASEVIVIALAVSKPPRMRKLGKAETTTGIESVNPGKMGKRRKVGDVVTEGKELAEQEPAQFTGRDLLRLVLCDPKYTKAAFKMDKLSAALHLDLGLTIAAGIDLLSTKAATRSRHSLAAIIEVLGGEDEVDKDKLDILFSGNEGPSSQENEISAMQSWLAFRALSLLQRENTISSIPRINTVDMDSKVGTSNIWAFLVPTDGLQLIQHLRVLSEAIRTADLSWAAKPDRTSNDVDVTFNSKNRKVNLTSTRYKTRITHSRNQVGHHDPDRNNTLIF